VRRWEARAALTVVEDLGQPSLEERCARYLARHKKAITSAHLAAMLSLSGAAVTTAQVNEALAAHPAFSASGQEGFSLGRPANLGVISNGTPPAAPIPPKVIDAALPTFPRRLSPSS
jgi:hypothetical protein